MAEGQLVRPPIGTGLTEGPVGLMSRAAGGKSPPLRMLVQTVRRAVVLLKLD
ncbi:hypothetical protein [Paracoccus salsus]|uniref:hypothetical protein n=1 Tax=Paracoccus salsus TaxID=2911061 RepID=UPI001F4247BD|nr:hypothetical protein [Paracoccus salsus]MCF3972219.1 hypothetical protein [Paracoccus salsus]